MTVVARRPVGVRGSDDEGTSLIELVVGMTVLSIFLGMFTGAVISMYQSTNKAEAVNLSSQQLNSAFLNLDKTLRYAAAISAPGTGVGGDWYVEFRTPNAEVESCTQLRVDTDAQQLQQQTWNTADPPDPAARSFTPLASGITNGPADQPFALLTPGVTTLHQQLTLNFVSLTGSGSTETTSRSTFALTALNSSIPASAADLCQQQEGRP